MAPILEHSEDTYFGWPKSILGGTRTLNLEIRSLTPYPVRPRGLMLVKQKGMPRVGFEPTHSFEYLNLSQAP